MICIKCGQEIDETAKFCRYCGEPVQGVATEGAITEVLSQPAPNVQPMVQPAQALMTPQKKNGAVVGVIAALAAVLVIVLMVLAVIVFGKNEKTPLNNIENILNKKPTNIGSIVEDVAPKFVSKAYLDAITVIKGNDEYKDAVEEIYEESEKNLEDFWEEMYDGLEDEFGKNVKFSYKIEDKEDLEDEEIEFAANIYQDLGQYKDQISEIIEILAETTELEDKEVKKLVKIAETLCDELEGMKIKKGYRMEVEITVEGKDDDDSENVDIAVIKANGEWFIDPILTYVINEDVDADELEELYDEEIKDSLDSAGEFLDEIIDELEEEIEDIDEDIIEEILDMILSDME